MTSELIVMDDVRVSLPTLTLEGYVGWLCTVCVRVALPDQRPWSWFGCETCRQVDAQIASRFGARRLLPLGQHSIMNGTGLRLDIDDESVMAAVYAEFLALGRGWKELGTWKAQEGARLVAIAEERFGEVPASVPLATWQEWFPPGEAASIDAYDRLMAERGDPSQGGA